MRDIVSPLSGFGSPFGQRRRTSPFAALMSTLGEGAAQLIAHPLEYGSMFIDRAGTTPVTESGQLVGLVLDHGFTGKAPVAGPELVTNGGFDTDTSGWTAVNATLSVVSNELRITKTNTNGQARQTITTAGGKFYKVTADLTDAVDPGANLRIAAGSSAGLVNLGAAVVSGGATSASLSFIFAATGASSFLQLYSGGGTGYIQFDNISVRELKGNHATAVSDAARGIFRNVGGFRYIEYNGVNTAYQTPVLPSPGVDKVQVFSGASVPATSETRARVLCEIGSTVADNGTFSLRNRGPGVRFSFASNGTSLADVDSSVFSGDKKASVTGIGDISAPFLSVRVDGDPLAVSAGNQGVGNYNPSGTYQLNYGSRAATTAFWSGLHYATLGPLVRFGTNATEAQIEAAEAYYTARTDL